MTRARRCALLACFSLLASMVPNRAAAQTLLGTLRSETDSGAIGGAVVLLMTLPSDSVLARTTTSTAGRFVLRAPRDGRYALRILRIGQRPFKTREFELSTARTLTSDFAVPSLPVALAAFNVRVDAVCRVAPDESSLVGQLLTEARTAWQASWSVGMNTEYVADYVLFEQSTDLRGRKLSADSLIFRSRATDRPFSSLSPALISAQGYVTIDSTGTTYRGPDESIMLSREFAEEHCFQLVTGTGERDGARGISFRPIRLKPNVVDIRGTIWLHPGTNLLADVEYRYEALRSSPILEAAGGRVVFAQLSNGAWLIRDWHITMPVLLERRSAPTLGGVPRARQTQTRVESLRVVGGTVASMVSRAGDSAIEVYSDSAAIALREKFFSATRPAATGSRWVAEYCAAQSTIDDDRFTGAIDGVVSGDHGRPVAGTTVRVQWNTQYRVTSGSVQYKRNEAVTKSDSSGRFVLCGLPIDHPLTGAVLIGGNSLVTRSIRIPPGSPVESIHFNIGRVSSWQASALRLRILADSVPVAGADVTLIADDREWTERSDANGIATFTDVRTGSAFVRVRKLGLAPFLSDVRIAEGTTTIDVPMSSATVLDEFKVTASAASVARLSAAAERIRVGLPNAAFSADQLASTGSPSLSTVLRRVPGLRIADSSGVTVAVSTRGERLVRGAMVSCVLLVMVDGTILKSAGVDAVPLQDIGVVEVYLGPARIPPQLIPALGEPPCGVVAVWTKSG